MIIEALISGAASGCLVGLVALALTAVMYATDIIVFATGEILMAGAMGYYVLVGLLRAPWLVALVGALIVAVGTALLIDKAIVTPLLARKATVVMCIIGTFAASTVLSQGTQLLAGPLGRSVPFIGGFERIRIGSIAVLAQQVVVISIAVLVTVGFWLLMNRTTIGIAYRATGINPRMSSLVGIDVRSMRMFAFAIMGVSAGLAGALTGPWTGVQALMGTQFLLDGFIACIIGGIGNPYGGMVAGVSLGILSVLLTMVGLSGISAILMFGLVVVLLIVRPSGLFGQSSLAR